MGIRKIIKLFENGNVNVTGLRGTGKDVLFSNVIARRKSMYISNVDYNCKNSDFIKIDFKELDVKNTFRNFINDDLVFYDYPYPEKADIYISDAGVYFPSQYQSDLCKLYPNMPVFQALSRHLGDCNFHCNVQNFNRLWDKIREQSDTYLSCQWCKVFFHKIVIMKVIEYDKEQSCIDRIKPFKPLGTPLFASSEAKATIRTTNLTLKNKYDNEYGKVKSHLLIFLHKANYDSRLFKSLLLGGNKIG